MRAARAFLVLLLVLPAARPLLAAAAPAPRSETYKQGAGPFLVAMSLFDWEDKARNRPVPVKVYAPATGQGPFPVIVFSHGLGGSREGYKYLGQHWASYGYVVVHVQHLGSDVTVFKKGLRMFQAMREAVADPRNAVARPLDVKFVLDHLEKMNQGGSPLAHRLDLTRVGMAGHSFGAWTTLAVAGQQVGRQAVYADPRVKAAIAMSAPAPHRGEDPDRVYAAVHIPILHMTGTLDDSPLGDTTAAQRRIPFDHIRGADQYLVTFQGGDHMVFSGRILPGGLRGEKDPLFQDLILQGTTAFWDAYLKGDGEAKAWLDRSYGAVLGRNGKLEKKPFNGKP
jgi:predicted dienelactone hydrolase